MPIGRDSRRRTGHPARFLGGPVLEAAFLVPGVGPQVYGQAVKSQRVWLNGSFPNPRACTGMSW
jgi:hypothetical protein